MELPCLWLLILQLYRWHMKASKSEYHFYRHLCLNQSFRLIHTTSVKAFFATHFFLFDHSGLACTRYISHSIVYYASGDKITGSAEFLNTISVIVLAASYFLSICTFSILIFTGWFLKYSRDIFI